MVYRELIEEVTDYFSKEERYVQEIVAAKENFFAKTGKVFEEESQYEGRMAAFVEWFMCDRPLRSVGLTPIRYYFEMFEATLPPQTRDHLKNLFKSNHSLFFFRDRNQQTVAVEDLFDGKVHEIAEKRQYVGISRGTIFEGRIVRKDDVLLFSDTYCVHPIDAAPLIKKEIERRRCKNRDEFLEFVLQLAGLRLKCDRYKRVEIGQIYDFTTTAVQKPPTPLVRHA